MRMCRFLVGVLFGAVSAAAGDGGDRRDRVVFKASERPRGEFVDWFRPHTGARSANRYGSLGSRLRAGVSVDVPPPPVRRPRPGHRFANLPEDAVVPRTGALGPGALYLLHMHDRSQGEPSLKLGFLTLRRSGFAATGGRFETPTVSRPSLPIRVSPSWSASGSPNGWSAPSPTRTSRGASTGVDFSYDRPGCNVTAMAARPTHGGFEVPILDPPARDLHARGKTSERSCALSCQLADRHTGLTTRK